VFGQGRDQTIPTIGRRSADLREALFRAARCGRAHPEFSRFHHPLFRGGAALGKAMRSAKSATACAEPVTESTWIAPATPANGQFGTGWFSGVQNGERISRAEANARGSHCHCGRGGPNRRETDAAASAVCRQPCGSSGSLWGHPATWRGRGVGCLVGLEKYSGLKPAELNEIRRQDPCL